MIQWSRFIVGDEIMIDDVGTGFMMTCDWNYHAIISKTNIDNMMDNEMYCMHVGQDTSYKLIDYRGG